MNLNLNLLKQSTSIILCQHDQYHKLWFTTISYYWCSRLSGLLGPRLIEILLAICRTLLKRQFQRGLSLTNGPSKSCHVLLGYKVMTFVSLTLLVLSKLITDTNHSQCSMSQYFNTWWTKLIIIKITINVSGRHLDFIYGKRLSTWLLFTGCPRCLHTILNSYLKRHIASLYQIKIRA